MERNTSEMIGAGERSKVIIWVFLRTMQQKYKELVMTRKFRIKKRYKNYSKALK